MKTHEKVTNIPVKQEKPRRTWLGKHRAQHPADPFEEMDRVFDRLMPGIFPTGWVLPSRFELPARFNLSAEIPSVDLIDRGEKILLRAEFPGVNKDDLDVTLADNIVTLRGKVSREEEREEDDYYYCETGRGEFVRTVTLPAEIDGSKAQATYKDGVLELTLPKAEVAKPKKIKVE